MARRAHDQIGKYRLVRHADGWRVVWDEQGRVKRVRLGIAKSVAKHLAVAEFKLFVRGREAAIGQDLKVTLGTLFEAYAAEAEREGKSHQKVRYQWQALKATFADLQPGDLDLEVIVDGKVRTLAHKYAADRWDQKIARDTIVSELMLVRTILNWAVKRKRLTAADVPFVWVPSAGKGRKTALSEDQIIRLLGAIVEATFHIRLAILIALATGARKAAIEELQWSRVFLDERSIAFGTGEEKHILVTGHEKGRATVDIGEGLYEALKRAKDLATCDFVIEWRGGAAGDIKKGVRRVFQRAGLGDRFMGLHALRHTLATAASEQGLEMRKIQKMLGHDDIDTTDKVYAEVRRGYLRDVAQVADAHIRQVNGVKSADKSQAGLKAIEAKKADEDDSPIFSEA